MTSSAATPATRTFAVCGSTGKATTCYIVEHMVAAIGRSTAIHSTVESKVGAQRTPIERDRQPDLVALRRQAQAEQIDDVILELQWPDFSEDSAAGLGLDFAAFTHIDPAYEGDALEVHRRQAIAALSAAGRAVVLVDSPQALELAEQVPGAITVGTRSKGPDADWLASVNHSAGDHMDFTITHRSGRSVSMSLWLPARFSVGLAALALVMVMEAGASIATLARALPQGLRPVVPGRMERVANHPRCIVDISHTPARLARALEPLRRTTKKDLVVVVAARVDDSPQTRRQLGEVAAIADSVVVTDDDYGADIDAGAIRADVLAGAAAAGAAKLAEVSPRRVAIRGAVALAGRDDTVLISGRGHLTRLEVAGTIEHVDDRAEARAGLTQREGRNTEPE
ncbi:MAG: glutamate ligase domain-containing protein [Beutenbergiaceae bacterium]